MDLALLRRTAIVVGLDDTELAYKILWSVVRLLPFRPRSMNASNRRFLVTSMC